MLTFSFGTATLTRPRDDADQSAPGVTPRGAPSTGTEREATSWRRTVTARLARAEPLATPPADVAEASTTARHPSAANLRFRSVPPAPKPSKYLSQQTGSTSSARAREEPRLGQCFGSPWRVHPEEDEWFYVLEGALTFWVGDSRLSLQAGSSKETSASPHSNASCRRPPRVTWTCTARPHRQAKRLRNPWRPGRLTATDEALSSATGPTRARRRRGARPARDAAAGAPRT